jgi:cell division protein ZapA
MTEVKVVIGERSFAVACNPGEQSDVIECAKLLNDEAEMVQGQLGRLPEDKLLLLSGLMIGDKVRSLSSKVQALEEQLSNYENIKKEIVQSSPSQEVDSEEKLRKISLALDKILSSLEESEDIKHNKPQDSGKTEVQNSLF